MLCKLGFFTQSGGIGNTRVYAFDCMFSFLRFFEDKDQCFVPDKSRVSEVGSGRNTIGVTDRNRIGVCLNAPWKGVSPLPI